MSCCFDKKIIQKYADNTIDPLEFIFLKEHLNYCDECKQELDLVMTLENELSKFFNPSCDVGELDPLIAELVKDCMEELDRSNRLKHAINKGMGLGSRIMENSMRFVEFIPGSKTMGKGVKKTASYTKGMLKALVKKEVGKLWASVL